MKITLRDLYNETMDKFNNDELTMEEVSTIAETPIVPRKLVEMILKELEEDMMNYSRTVDDDDFTAGKYQACLEYENFIKVLLMNLEMELKND